jgi:hypothetical protein
VWHAQRLLWLLVCWGLWTGAAVGAAAGPELLFLSGPDFVAARAAIARGDTDLAPALTLLRQECQAALAVGPFSVVRKDDIPPSGDKHDYMSRPPYWWPNPATSDGLPFVRRDGEVYPPSRTGDVRTLEEMAETVQTLALGYFYLGEERVAARAALLLREFFLDPATAMHPHLRYAQLIPGRTEVRGFGIIDTRILPRVCDAALLLVGSPAWTGKDMAGLRAWFSAYLDWLLDSPEGRQEQAAKNNHGTWYDAQVAGYALFCGRRDVARQALDRFSDRLAAQIAPDGAQPLELVRTKSLGYSIMNLEAYFSLMLLGDRLGRDLWRAKAPGGGSPRRALEAITPYLGGRAPWPHPQMTPVGHGRATAMLLRLAALRYGEPAYDAVFAAVFGKKAANRREWLLYPGNPGL